MEKKKAKLVVIAVDVDPIELVVWLPALCRKMEVPYCIVKSKALLGSLVNQKNATSVALTGVRAGDSQQFQRLQSTCKSQFNDNAEALRQWGGLALYHPIPCGGDSVRVSVQYDSVR